MTTATSQAFTIAASDLTFLLEGCPRCFVLKVKHGVRQPSMPLPTIFTILAGLQKDYYSGLRTEQISPELPPGIVVFGEKSVRSKPIPIPESSVTFTLIGRFDIVLRLDDGTYAVIDFKTGRPHPEKSDIYERQLLAYAYALEHPAEDAMGVQRVSHIGLLYFVPQAVRVDPPSRQTVNGDLKWVPLEKDYGRLYSTLSKAARLLTGPLPASNSDCEWCRYGDLYADRLVNAPGVRPVRIVPPRCPRCGGEMQLRRGSYGPFWGCINYPACTGTRPRT